MHFDYSIALKADYNYNTVKSNINYNRPVLLSGSNSSGGHMWVCDGYRVYNLYFDDCSGYSYLHLHMNWGWQNGLYNGWFNCGNFNPGNTSYNSNKKMIYNIIP